MTDAGRTLRDIRDAFARQPLEPEPPPPPAMDPWAWAAALAAERERCAAVVRRHLLFDSRPAVTRNEVQEAVAAILGGETP